VPMEGSDFELPCQLAISAIGQDTVLEGLTQVGGEAVELTRWETYKTDEESMATNVPGVFAGGDAANDGPTVVIDAIRDGQRAAAAIHAWVAGEERPPKPFIVTKDFWAKPGRTELGEVTESPRHEVEMIDVAERKGSFREVATGFSHEDKDHEVARCLSCGCLRYDDCKLRLYAQEYGVDMERFAGYVRKHKVDDRHPYLVYDPNKCVLCSRCIRTCARVLPISALGLVNRGFQAEMRPAMNDPLVETNCVSCGNCIDACPTGALTPKFPFPGRAALPVESVETRCGFCSLGCAIRVNKFGPGRYYIESGGGPGDYLCRYGRFGQELFIKRRRVTAPMVRAGEKLEEVELDRARETAVAGLSRLARKYGPQAIGVFVSPELTCEEQVVAQRIAREGLGTNNIGSLTILAAGKEAGALDGAFGFTASTAGREVLDRADLVILNNTNIEADHLPLSAQVIEAVKERGAKLIVTNSTLGDSDRALATLGLDPMRGRAAVLWQGIIARLMADGLLSPERVEGLPGGKAFRASLKHDPGTAAAVAGVEEEDLARAAALIAGSRRVAILHASDRVQDQAPGDIQTMGDLLLLLRAAGIEAELLLPRMNANSSGLVTAGADPAFTPGRGRAPAGLAGARSQEELRRMLREGELRGALVIGEDPMRHDRTAAFFQNLEFLVAMDWGLSETCQFADVVLPGTTYLESEGTRVNFEGRVRHYEAALTPPAGLPGWQVLARLGQGFGLGEPPAEAAALTGEVRRAVQEQAGRHKAYYFNEGEERDWEGKGTLLPLEGAARSASILPPLTATEVYKREIQEVGTEHFRVRPS